MDSLYITVSTIITLWSCPVNVTPSTTHNQCAMVQMEQSSQAPTLVPPLTTPAKQLNDITYTATGPNTTRSCGHPPNTRNRTGCYDFYTPRGTRP